MGFIQTIHKFKIIKSKKNRKNNGADLNLKILSERQICNIFDKCIKLTVRKYRAIDYFCSSDPVHRLLFICYTIRLINLSVNRVNSK